MKDYGYIGVAFHGHFDNKLIVKYSYSPEAGAADTAHDPDMLPEWQASLPDPDAIVRNFVSARECYVMWRNAIGHYFGLISTNPLDSRTGRVMVTLMVRSGDEANGRAVFTALNALKKCFVEDGELSDAAVERVLASSGIPAQPLMLPAWKTSDSDGQLRPMCYRTYLSTRELETMFSFPDQTEYAPFAYTIVITATSSLRPGVNVDRITAPVKKVYSVVCPPDVTASQAMVTDGERLTLTFSKPGFNARRETVTVGSPSPYLRLDGSVAQVKSSKESGMGFTRRVRLSVNSAKGGIINGYTISVNDRQVNTMEPFIELTESDIEEGRKLVIQAASNNYHPLKVELHPEDIDPEKGIALELVPIEQGIILRLDFGENRVFEHQISIEKNTPEYSQLHSGNFHGFRAHRLAAPGEVYHVDVRAAGKPVTPAFENVAARNEGASTAKRVVPVFEKLGGHRDKPAATAAAPKAENPVEETKRVEEKKPVSNHRDADEERPMRRTTLRPGLFVGLVVVVAAIICGIIFLPTWSIKPSKSVNAVADEDVAVAVADAPVAADTVASSPAPAPAKAALSAEEQADLEYLNAQRSWKRADLKSESAQALFDAIAKGDIKAFVEHAYFTTEGRATNRDALNVADLVWTAYGSPTQRSNELAMKRLAKNDAVNLWDLYEAVARVKPKDDEANKTPRPGAPVAPANP